MDRRHFLSTTGFWLVAGGSALAADTGTSSRRTSPAERAAGEEPNQSPQERPASADSKTYALRYRFAPGEVLRWSVVHRVKVRSTIAGTTQIAETQTRSTKVWRVRDVHADGRVSFVHSVDEVQMVQRVSDRQDVTYDSRTDATPPPGFEQVAESVGVPLTAVVMDAQGKILDRRDRTPKPLPRGLGQMTIALPEQPVAVGQQWSVPSTIDVRLRDGETTAVKIRQQFTLESVDAGVAVIGLQTQVLSPVHNPEILVQLVQEKAQGKIRFDIDAGRILSQHLQWDDRVVGFQTEASSMHFQSDFEEKLLSDAPAAATRTQGPSPAPPRNGKTVRRPTTAPKRK